MQPASRPRQFLLRASLLSIVMLAVWWVALRAPLLALLRGAARIPLAVVADVTLTVEPSGGWTFRVPVDDPAKRYDSVDFTVPPFDVGALTLGLPIFWAVALAVGGRPRAGVLLKGSLLLMAIATVSLVLFVEVSAYNVLAGMRPGSTAFAGWARDLTSYLATGVIPYAAPLIAALWLHPEFRGRIFACPDLP